MSSATISMSRMAVSGFVNKAVEAAEFLQRDRTHGNSAVRSAGQEIADRRSDIVAVRLQRKVASVEETHFRTRNIALERFGALRQKERVVLPPNCQKPRLVLAEIGLEFRVKRD